jgi:uncharacterized metal-binding protein
MSAGIVHTRACFILAAGFATGITQDPATVQYIAGAVAGIICSPDLDVDSGFIAYQYIGNIPYVGKPLSWVWRKLWYSYATSLKHGSILSHFPIIGTLGRMAYLFLFLLVIPYLVLCLFVPYDFVGELNWWANFLFGYWRVLVGLVSADFIHWGLDILTTEHKQKKKAKNAGMDMPNVRRDIPKTQTQDRGFMS